MLAPPYAAAACFSSADADAVVADFIFDCFHLPPRWLMPSTLFTDIDAAYCR
jgi:hypothetical protein